MAQANEEPIDLAQAMAMMAHAVNNVNARSAVPPPPIFDNRDPTYTIKDLFTLFEPYAKAVYGPESKAWLLALQPFVEGDAKAALTAIGPVHSTYQEAKERLIETYSPKTGNRASPHAQFITAERRMDESPQVFRFRLERLANEAFGDSEDKEKLLVSKFLMNIAPDIKTNVEAHMLNYDEPTLDSVVELASTLERNKAPAVSNTEWVSLVRQSAQGTEPLKCYQCGQPGHFARNCRRSTAEKKQVRHNMAEGNISKCVFCEGLGHTMAKCDSFRRLISKCSWCGADDHESYRCKEKPGVPNKNSGNCIDVNMLMQTKELISDGNAYYVAINVANVTLNAMIDNGSSVCLIRESIVFNNDSLRHLYKSADKKLRGFGEDSEIYVKGKVTVSISIAGLASAPVEFYVVKDSSMNCSVLLGLNFLEDHYMLIDTVHRTLRYCPPVGDKIDIDLFHKTDIVSTVRTLIKETIPARTRCQIKVRISNKDLFEGQTGYFQPDYDNCSNAGVIFAYSLNTVDEGAIIIEALNVYDSVINIDKNTVIGNFKCDHVNFAETIIDNSDIDDAAALFDLSQTELTRDQIQKVRAVLNKYHMAISKHENDLGHTQTVSHSIDVQGAPPHKQRYRRLQGNLREEVETEIKRLEEKGIIEPSHSAWCSPIVPVRKKDKSLRLCIDYRLLNAKTKLDSFPLPNMEDILSNLKDSVYFSTLDMAKGYYQIPVEDESRELTAFSSGNLLYQFKVLPFGVANGVATYQRLMSLVLAGIAWDVCIAYIDDLIVLGRSFNEHLANLEIILDRLSAHNLKIKPSKCDLFKTSVKYLGHVVTPNGILPNKENIEAILAYPQPQTVRQVKRFVGMVNFFRRFIKNASDIMQPLHEVTKAHKLNWTDRCTTAFETLKSLLAQPPILAYPDFKPNANPLIITTDASSVAAGAVLSQVHNGDEQVLAYASSSFNAAERNYSATERELAAIRWAVKHFYPFVYGRQYIIRTDHKPLIYLSNMKNIDSKLMRTLQDLNVGQYQIEYIPGNTNVVADALSRTIDFTDCTDEIDEGFRVDTTTEYVTMPGGPSSLFQCLAYALYGSTDEHINLRSSLVDRLIKNTTDFKLCNGKKTKQYLHSMKNPDVLPCWQVLMAFAKEHDISVKVCQDGVGVVLFAADRPKSVIHLHSLGGVHFNLMELRDTLAPSTTIDPIKIESETVYILENDENKAEQTELQTVNKTLARGNISNDTRQPGDLTITATGRVLSRDRIRLMQQNDDKLCTLIKWIEGGKPHHWIRKQASSLYPYTKLIKSVLSNLTCVNGVLEKQGVPLIPEAFLDETVLSFHVASGHMGRDKTLVEIKKFYYSDKLNNAVNKIVRECQLCQLYKGNSRGGAPLVKRAPLHVYEQYAVDLLELPPARGHVRYLLVGVDVYSRFMNAVPLKDKSSKTVVEALEQRVFPGLVHLPKIIITDNGPEFRADLFSELMAKYAIKQYTTIPYLPATNGRVERVNQTLQQMLAVTCAERKSDWLDELPKVLIMYNHSRHSQTGRAPAAFFSGEETKLPLPTDEYWKEQTSKFKPYKRGERVGYKLPTYARRGKLSPRYKGPCQIVATDGRGLTYDVLCEGEERIRKAHYKQLKPWYGAGDVGGKEIIKEVPTEQSLQHQKVVSVEEQVKNRVDLGEVLKVFQPMVIMANLELATTDSPGSVPDESTASRYSMDSLQPWPLQPPPTPVLQWTEESNVGLAHSELPLHGRRLELETTPEEDKEDLEQSPQMLTRHGRRVWEAARAAAAEGMQIENCETSFEGFADADLLTSTPYRCDAMHGSLRAGDRTDSESLHSEAVSQMLCSTCGTVINQKICNCNNSWAS